VCAPAAGAAAFSNSFSFFDQTKTHLKHKIQTITQNS
jgi:hypothetical protein